MRLFETTRTLLFMIVCNLTLCHGANILFYWGFSGMSHRISVWPLVEKLTEIGHNVTFISPTKSKTPNPNVIEKSSAHAFSSAVGSLDFLVTRISEGPSALEKLWAGYLEYGISNCNAILSDKSTMEWIQSSSFDLIVINSFLNDCAYGLAHMYKVPYIIYGPTSPFGWWTEAFGYPDEVFPEWQFHYPEDMSFLQKVRTAIQPLYWQFFREWYTFPKIEEIIRDKLNISDMPSIADMERNANLGLLYTHFSEEYARSLPPSIVQVAGMHLTDERKPLPKDVLEFIDSGSNGFVYFSYGTFANPKDFTQSFQNMVFNAMGNLSTIQFVVKWHEDISHKLPKNVKTVTWISQQDLLAHPKILAFISHGGALGTQEAVYFGVPMIVMPLFADQDYNAIRIHSRRRGIRLEVCGLTQQTFEAAIQEIMTDETYRVNTRHASKLFKDRENKPVDTAVWWVEYVLRNKNTSHLLPLGSKRSWYERRMLDVWGFIGLVILFGILGLLFILRKVIVVAKRFRQILTFESHEPHTSKKTN